MTAHQLESGAEHPETTLLDRLATATPDERAEIVLRRLQADPGGVLTLEGRDGQRARLDGVDLSRAALETRAAELGPAATWWDRERQGIILRGAALPGASLRLAKLSRADLRGADLRRALLGDADLRGALLEQVVLEDADLGGADLSEATLGEADLRGAMLEDAQLKRASLRFARLQNATLEQANLEEADLWGANFQNAVLTRANLQRVRLEEADLRGAQLTGAQLQDAELRGANLEGANLQGTKLQGMDLTECNIRHAYFARAWLSKTELRREQLGGAIGEELAGDYEGARQGYVALERNFTELGDADAASWAYTRKRRMQKRATLRRSRAARRGKDWRAATGLFLGYIGQELVEWLCDYGESTGRVLRATLLMYALYTGTYVLGGMLGRPEETEQGTILVPSYDVFEIAVYSLLAMSTAGYFDIGLQPTTNLLHVLSGLQGVSLMVLAGLFGFVFANRIRR